MNGEPTDKALTKGQRTAQRLMDVSENLFARQGYEGTTLRQIADAAGLQEPGIYNHFSGKQALYEAVLNRALNPLAQAMTERLATVDDVRDFTDLPAAMTDLLLEHPQMAALFQQALQGDESSVGAQLVQAWLERLFRQGLESLETMGAASAQDTATLAINVIAMFNVTAGYFLSQRAFDCMAEGNLSSDEHIARQKTLLRRVMRAMLVS
jgi:AcrR family transcriptional regulator